MKRTWTWALSMTAAGTLALACAKATDSGMDMGSGGSAMTSGGSSGVGGFTPAPSGGAPSTSGGASGVGGTAMTGGNPGTGGAPTPDCMDDETDLCANHSTDLPEGEALCVDGLWDLSDCTLCAPDAEVNCADVPANGGLDFGTAVCDEEGSSYDLSACSECDAEGSDTIACTAIVEADHEYTGGTASCDPEGSWDQSTCEWCGDGVINGTEQCEEGDVPDMACVDLGLDEGDSGGANLPCNTATCRFDTSACSACTEDVTPANCMEGDAASCTTSSSCTNKQCGVGSTCNFDCATHEGACTGMTCNMASCSYACPSSAACSFTCLPDSTCQNTARHQSTLTANCQAGSTCDLTCAGGGTPCNVNCIAGSSCSVDGNSNNARPAGTAYCATGDSCSYEFNTGRDIHDLDIICQSGATCVIEQKSYGSDLSGLLCEAGSTCNLACPGDGTCSYVCEDGATCACTHGGNGGGCECTGAGCP